MSLIVTYLAAVAYVSAFASAENVAGYASFHPAGYVAAAVPPRLAAVLSPYLERTWSSLEVVLVQNSSAWH